MPSLALWRAVEARLFAEIQLEEPVLDLGCGNGFFAEIALNKQVRCGCDTDLSQVRRARLSEAYRNAVAADARMLPYKDQSFATIISNCTLEHICNLEQALHEISRVLIPGGKLVFTVPTEKFNDWFCLSWFLNKLGLRGLAKRKIELYNKHQFHHHIYPVRKWSLILEQAGFRAEEHRYYASRCFFFLFSALDDIHHIFARLISSKTDSSEAKTSQITERLADSVFGNIAGAVWWSLFRYFYRKESSIAPEGAAVLIQAAKRAS